MIYIIMARKVIPEPEPEPEGSVEELKKRMKKLKKRNQL
jgi:hypothetical protein